MPSAMRVRWAEFRVSVVSIVAGLILLTLIYLLTGGTLLQPKARLYLYVPDATGLSSESPVRVDGVGVGKVDRVGFSGSNDPERIIRVQMTVERNRLPSITADSVAQISNDTLVGDKFVDVSTGSAPAHISENGTLRFKATPDIVRSFDVETFERQLRAVDATLDDIEQGRTETGKFILGDQVYVSLRTKFTGLQTALRKATESTTAVGGLLYNDELYQKMRAPLVELDRKVALLQSGQTDMGRFLRDPAQFASWRQTLADLERGVAELHANSFMQSDEAYSDWTHKLAGLTQQVDEFNASPLFSTASVYENLAGSMGEMQRTVKDFRENPRKYLRLKVF